MIVKLLTEHYLEFLSLKGGCRGLSESTLVKMSNCWKSHAVAQLRVLRSRSSIQNCTDITNGLIEMAFNRNEIFFSSRQEI